MPFLVLALRAIFFLHGSLYNVSPFLFQPKRKDEYMLYTKISYVIKRLYQLGLTGSCNAITRRTNIVAWRLQMKRKALSGHANHTWKIIVQRKHISFESFFEKVKNNDLLKKIATNQLFVKRCKSEHIQSPENICNHTISLLGSGDCQLGTPIQWHREFKAARVTTPFATTDTKQTYARHTTTFHTEIPVPQEGTNPTVYHEDIKVFWELGRMHHLSALGYAYQKNQNELYAQEFSDQIDSFQKQVQYLLGPHWKCPMDVAIRAINLIWSLEYFKKSPSLSLAFWESYTTLLYDHFIYLKWNFEESDKPNNHLLADYVGYLYLAHFFITLPGGKQTFSWIEKRIEHAFMQQILPDGTAYEGSTAYHRLDCELLLHTTVLLRERGFPNQNLEALLNKMLIFFDEMHDQKGNFVTVGDDDSGSIVFGIKQETQPKVHTTAYKDFGISIMQTSRFHMTLRTPQIQPTQPSGHFHHDGLSITLSINGQPLFVDPGSFIYTGNRWWREYFKSAQQHTTFTINREAKSNRQTQTKTTDLFQTKSTYKTGFIDVGATHMQGIASNQLGDWLERTITRKDDTCIIIKDAIKPTSPGTVLWRFILHPSISPIQTHDGFDLVVDGQIQAKITSNLQLQIKDDAAYAPEYGVFHKTKALEATLPVTYPILVESLRVTQP